jgi:hypothetical protein
MHLSVRIRMHTSCVLLQLLAADESVWQLRLSMPGQVLQGAANPIMSRPTKLMRTRVPITEFGSPLLYIFASNLDLD